MSRQTDYMGRDLEQAWARFLGGRLATRHEDVVLGIDIVVGKKRSQQKCFQVKSTGPNAIKHWQTGLKYGRQHYLLVGSPTDLLLDVCEQLKQEGFYIGNDVRDFEGTARQLRLLKISTNIADQTVVRTEVTSHTIYT